MSVLIKGMNTPYGCANCDFVGSPIYDSKGRATNSCNVPVKNIRGKDVTDHVIAMYEGARMSFPEWCPLVEFPEKHGDLIDRDEVRNAVFHHLSIKGEENLLPAEKSVFGNIIKAEAVIEAEGEA